MNLNLIRSLTGLFLIALLGLFAVMLVSKRNPFGLFRDVTIIRITMNEAYVAPGSPVFFRGIRIGQVQSVETPPTRTDGQVSAPLVDGWFDVLFQIEDEWARLISDDYVVTLDAGALGGLSPTRLILALPSPTESVQPELPAVAEEAVGVAVLQQPGPVVAPVAEPAGEEEPTSPPQMLFNLKLESALANPDGARPIYMDFYSRDSLQDSTEQVMSLVTRSLEAVHGKTIPRLDEVLEQIRLLLEDFNQPQGDLRSILRNANSVSAALDRQLNQPDSEMLRMLTQLERLTTELNRPDGSLRSTLDQVARAAAALEQGDGIAAALLRDPAWKEQVGALLTHSNSSMEQLTALLETANRAATEVAAVSQDLPELTKRLRQILGRVDLASRALPGVAEEVRQAIEQANTVLQAIEDLPLIRSRISRPEGVPPLVLPAMTSPPAGKP